MLLRQEVGDAPIHLADILQLKHPRIEAHNPDLASSVSLPQC
jgi:hypothetical protein